MPTYSYRCTECGDSFDIHQSFSDASLTVCPACGGALRKVFSPVGVSFTGSGFYRNDSRTKSEREKAATSSGGTDSSGSTGSSDNTGSSSTTKAEKPAPAAKEKAATSTPSHTTGSAKTPAKDASS